MNKLIKAITAIVIGIALLSVFLVKPNNQKKEWKGVVLNNYNGSSEVIMSEIEAPFKQTVKSKEEIINATVISANGKIVEVKDSRSTIYRITEEKVNSQSELQVGQVVQVSVIPKTTSTIRMQGVYPTDSLVSMRISGLDKGTIQRYEDGVPVYKYDAAITNTEVKSSEAGKLVLVSNGKAHTVSLCTRRGEPTYYLYQEGKHDKDGLFKVDESGKSLVAIDLNSIDTAPCTKRDGDMYETKEAVFKSLPMTKKDSFPYGLLLIGVPLLGMAIAVNRD